MIEILKKIGGESAINQNLKCLINGIKFNPGIDSTDCFYEALILAAAIPRYYLIEDDSPDYVIVGFSDSNFRYFRDVFDSDEGRLSIINKRPHLSNLEDFYHKRLAFYSSKVKDFMLNKKHGVLPSEITHVVFEKPLISHLELVSSENAGRLQSKDAMLMGIISLRIMIVFNDIMIKILP